MLNKKSDNTKGSISLENIRDLFLLLYLCAISGNQLNEGFDFIFSLGTFILFVGFSLLIQITKKRFKFTSLLGWIIFFICFALTSVLWAPSSSNVLALNTTFLQLGFVVFCFTNNIEKNEDIERVLSFVVISLIYSALLLVIKTPSDVWGTERIGNEIGLHSNDVGFRFAIGVIISFYFIKFKSRYYYLLPIVGFIFLVLYSGSRKGLIMVLIGLIACIVYSGKKQVSYKDLLVKILKVCLAFGVFIGIMYFVMNNETFYSIIGVRMESLFSAFSGESLGDASIVERDFFKQQAWNLFLDNPILGYGHNCFSNYLSSINYGFLTYSHNNYLEILSALGIVGFLIYYSMIISMIINLFKLFTKKDKNRGLLFISILFLILICLVSWWQVNYSSKFLMVMYSLIYMFIRINKEERAIKDE